MEINRSLELTFFNPQGRREELFGYCHDAKANNVRALCVQPRMVAQARHLLNNSETLVVAPVSFPFGYALPETQAAEAAQLIAAGAEAIEMCIDTNEIHEGRWVELKNEMLTMREVCRKAGGEFRMALEIEKLSAEHLAKFCALVSEVHPAMVCTSSGFFQIEPHLGKAADMRRMLPHSILLKIQGSFSSYDAILNAFTAGADRVGTDRIFQS